MDKYTISKSILLMQMIISTVFLGVCTYYLFPLFDMKKEMIGFYYSGTAIISFFICILVEFIMNKIYVFLGDRAKQLAINSSHTEEYTIYKEKLKKDQQNRFIKQYQDRYDKDN